MMASSRTALRILRTFLKAGTLIALPDPIIVLHLINLGSSCVREYQGISDAPNNISKHADDADEKFHLITLRVP